MATDYVSLTTGMRRLRLRRRRALYLLLALLCGAVLVFMAVRFSHNSTPVEPAPAQAFHAKSQAVQAVEEAKPSVLIPFVPTDEWQDVPHDAVLPAGCEIDINFQTGSRRARLRTTEAPRSRLPAIASLTDNPVHEPTEIEAHIAHTASSDPAEAKAALKALNERAFKGDYGTSIVHARNLAVLLNVLRSHSALDVRLAVASILAAAIHNNPASLKDNSPATRAIVSAAAVRLASEDDFDVYRRLVAVVTYAAQIDGPETLSVFAASGGLAALATLNGKRSLVDPAFAEREAMLLAELYSADKSLGKKHTADILTTLDSVLGMMNVQHKDTVFSDMANASIHTLCEDSSLPSHISSFCTANRRE